MRLAPATPKARVCFSCGNTIGANDVICITCGSDQQTGNRLVTALADADATPAKNLSAEDHERTPPKATTPPPDDRIASASGTEHPSSPHRGIKFSIGFFGSALVMLCVVLPLFSGSNKIEPVVGAFIFLFVAMASAFFVGQRHIGFGILTLLGILLAIPLLALGACFGMANGCR